MHPSCRMVNLAKRAEGAKAKKAAAANPDQRLPSLGPSSARLQLLNLGRGAVVDETRIQGVQDGLAVHKKGHPAKRHLTFGRASLEKRKGLPPHSNNSGVLNGPKFKWGCEAQMCGADSMMALGAMG